MYLVIDKETQECVAVHSHKKDAEIMLLDYEQIYGRSAYIQPPPKPRENE